MNKNFENKSYDQSQIKRSLPKDLLANNTYYKDNETIQSLYFNAHQINQRFFRTIEDQYQFPYDRFVSLNPYLKSNLIKRSWNDSEFQSQNMNDKNFNQQNHLHNLKKSFYKMENVNLMRQSSLFKPISKKSNDKCKICFLNRLCKEKSEKMNNCKILIDENSNKKKIYLNDSNIESENETINTSQRDDKNKKKILFIKLNQLIMKLFSDQDIVENDLNFNPILKNIVIQIISKKRLCKYINIKDCTAEKLNKIKNTKDVRRSEERLKFIFKKCIKHLQKIFKNDWKTGKIEVEEVELEPSLSKNLKFDYIFYNYYFKEISEKIKQPIEKFFHFRNWKNRTSTDIPKSITKIYVNYLKMNKEFMKLFIDYMKNNLLDDIKFMNSMKIEKMIINWKKELFQTSEDFDQSLKTLLKKFKKKKVKLPWSHFEIQNAIDETYRYLTND